MKEVTENVNILSIRKQLQQLAWENSLLRSDLRMPKRRRQRDCREGARARAAHTARDVPCAPLRAWSESRPSTAALRPRPSSGLTVLALMTPEDSWRPLLVVGSRLCVALLHLRDQRQLATITSSSSLVETRAGTRSTTREPSLAPSI